MQSYDEIVEENERLMHQMQVGFSSILVTLIIDYFQIFLKSKPIALNLKCRLHHESIIFAEARGRFQFAKQDSA